MAKEAVVRASVHIGTPDDLPGFGLAVDLKVDGVDQELLDAAHGVRRFILCPKISLLILLLALPLQSCIDQGNQSQRFYYLETTNDKRNEIKSSQCFYYLNANAMVILKNEILSTT